MVCGRREKGEERRFREAGGYKADAEASGEGLRLPTAYARRNPLPRRNVPLL